jgi:glycosyltransferase involved in cell wall biosynthesis
MKDNQPLVSVILCFYNEERFIEQAVHSVLNQKSTSWELILVDDGSSDLSVGMAKQYAIDYPGKVIYMEHESHSNKGLSASRNAGIRISRGEFVALIDADDIWLPDKLENQLAIFENHPHASVILESSLYWYSWNDPKAQDIPIPIGVAQDRIYEPPQLMLALYPLGKGAAPCPSGIMVRRSVFDKSKFEESFRGIYQMYEDQGFLCKIYLREKVFVSSACNNQYRQRPSSLVSVVYETGKYDTVRKYYLDWFENFLRNEKIENKDVNRLLKKAFLPYRHPIRYQLVDRFPKRMKSKIAGVLVRLGILHYPKKG